jgi:hypothetical protein
MPSLSGSGPNPDHIFLFPKDFNSTDIVVNDASVKIFCKEYIATLTDHKISIFQAKHVSIFLFDEQQFEILFRINRYQVASRYVNTEGVVVLQVLVL